MGNYLAEVPWTEAIRFKEGNGFRKEIHCFIPETPITYAEDNRNQEWSYVAEAVRTLIEKGFSSLSSPTWPLRLPSGGCLDIITDSTGKTFFPIEQRDDKPKIRAPGFQNPWLGYPESLEDCIFANHIRKEANQEALFSRRIPVLAKKPNMESLYTCRQTLLLPMEELERKTALATAEKLNLRLPTENLNATYDEENTDDTFYLYQNQVKKAEIRCSFTWYPTQDIIQVRRVILPVTIDEVLIYHKSSRTILIVAEEDLRGKLFGDEIEVIKISTSQNGERTANPDKAVFKPTSSLKGVLNHRGIYPTDWVEELNNLLSTKEFQKLLKENPDSDPFTLEKILWEMGKHP
ncbi:MAG: hypothetical protein ABH831_00325 [Candidatus Nealsonbacteria bacterium]